VNEYASKQTKSQQEDHLINEWWSGVALARWSRSTKLTYVKTRLVEEKCNTQTTRISDVKLINK